MKSISKEQSAIFKRFSTFKIPFVPINQILPKSNSNSNMLIHNTIKEIIFNTLCFICLTKKQRLKKILYSKGFKKFSYNMNISNYIKKMNEIDIFKYLLLKEQQIYLFNFISKPSVSLHHKKEIYQNWLG